MMLTASVSSVFLDVHAQLLAFTFLHSVMYIIYMYNLCSLDKFKLLQMYMFTYTCTIHVHAVTFQS